MVNNSVTVTYDNPASFTFDPAFVAINGISVQLGPVGGPYTVGSYMVSSQLQFPVGLNPTALSFTAQRNVITNTSLSFQLVIGGLPYYHDPLLGWQSTQNLLANSNTVSDINANLPTLFSDLNIITPVLISWNVIIQTTSTSATPSLTSVTLTSGWTNE